MDEKRAMVRFDLELPADISIQNKDRHPGVTCLLTSNISGGGAFFETNQHIPIGTRLELDLNLFQNFIKDLQAKNVFSITTLGTVIRAEDRGIAVCFDDDYKILPLEVNGLLH